MAYRFVCLPCAFASSVFHYQCPKCKRVPTSTTVAMVPYPDRPPRTTSEVQKPEVRVQRLGPGLTELHILCTDEQVSDLNNWAFCTWSGMSESPEHQAKYWHPLAEAINDALNKEQF